MCSQISLSLAFFLVSFLSFAQEVKVKGGFIGDSIKIGEQIPFTLTARYPKDVTLLFPDSTFAFSPFEFQKKHFFATKTTDGQSYDSVVYLLSTYEVDSVQTLKLPVFVVHKADCTSIFSGSDDVILKQLIKHVPDSVEAKDLPLKTNTDYQNVKWLFNYPIALIAAGTLLVLAIASFFIFGKSVRKYFYVRRLNRNHQSFIKKFNETVSGLQANFSVRNAEGALVLWKYYMENLIQTPYSKLTSKEILEKVKDEHLGHALKTIDRGIYGGVNVLAEESFDRLRSYSEQQFQLKLEEVKHG